MGLSLIFGVLEIVNFAHGEFYMLGAMGAYFLATQVGVGYWPTVLLALAGGLCIGYLLYEVLLVRIDGKGFERSILLTLGLSMVLQNLAIFLFTTTPKMIQGPLTYSNVSLGPLQVPVLRLFALGIGLAAFIALFLVLHRTQVGKAMRGVAQNREAALMVGIDPRAVSRLAVAIGIGMSGLAGAALAPVYAVHPLMGFAFVFKAFAIVIIGGLGNVSGAAIVAVALGVLENLIAGFLPQVMVDGIAFSAMILVLLVRPQGLFGRGVRV
ncbi:branched-chain amino acid ABC transporter permease [Ramlibacter rhizophilus]|uniref:Branched-chain amino acid ABC transporter permease n=2 Tax=Ramlibacter rhizophilus TaxID=1781167 RepID=A0A4Z0BK72_9BURK|nr:branched-chain amino acid ABC transporter permease [Ramlibacter rhizophilus]